MNSIQQVKLLLLHWYSLILAMKRLVKKVVTRTQLNFTVSQPCLTHLYRARRKKCGKWKKALKKTTLILFRKSPFVNYLSKITFRKLPFKNYLAKVTFRKLPYTNYFSKITFQKLSFENYLLKTSFRKSSLENYLFENCLLKTTFRKLAY